MSKKETPLYQLQQFLPPDTFQMVAPYFKKYTIHLTLTRDRKTVLGDYREPTAEHPYHRITVNVNLNMYNFLITLVHEMAHMVTHAHFDRKPLRMVWNGKLSSVICSCLTSARKYFLLI